MILLPLKLPIPIAPAPTTPPPEVDEDILSRNSRGESDELSCCSEDMGSINVDSEDAN